MKNVKFELCFSACCLANGTGPSGERDVFQRDNEDNIVFQQAAWFSAFAQGIDLARVRGIKPGDIHMNLSVKAPTEMYERRYGDGAHGESKYRVHEAIMPGTTVTFEAVVSDHVTESSLKEILTKIGKYVGLSPYGFRLGMGRFNVVSVEVEHSESDNPGNV